MEDLRCSRCGCSKPAEDFAWRRIKRGLRDTYCRPCRAAYKQEHYAKHRQRYIANASQRNARIRAERMGFLLEYLTDHPCVDCGERDVVVLEFDHREDKSFNISYGITNHSWAAVLAEMAKCEVVCANCHRRRTAKRGGFARASWPTRAEPQRRLFWSG